MANSPPSAKLPIGAINNLQAELNSKVSIVAFRAALKNKVSSTQLNTALATAVPSDQSALEAELATKASQAALDAHTGSTSNPHSVTAAQTGAYTSGQVDGLLADKADAADLTTLDGEVTIIQGQLDGLGAGPVYIFNVMNYGAVGDGVADDTQAILDAIDAAYLAPSNPVYGEQWGGWDFSRWIAGTPQPQGGMVFIPQGVYKITSRLPLRAFVTIYGQGSATIIKAVLPSNTTSGAFYSEIDTANQCQEAHIRDMSIRTDYGYGIDLSNGLLGGSVRNMTISSKKFSIYTPDTAYLQGCMFENITIRQMGDGGVRFVGNKNKVVNLSIGGNGFRAGVDRTAIEGMVVIKGSGWEMDHVHIETGSPVKSLKIGGAGPAYAGYGTQGVIFTNLWLETEGDPVNNIAWDLEDVYGMKVVFYNSGSSGKVKVKNVKDVFFETLGGDVEFDATDTTSVLTVGYLFDAFGISADRSESRIIVNRLTNQYYQELEITPTGRYGDMLSRVFTVTAYTSGATMTYENVTNIGWCWKINWTSLPNTDYIDINYGASPIAGLTVPPTNLWLSCIYDYAGASPPGFFIGFFYGFGGGGSILQSRWGNSGEKGPCKTKLYANDDMTGTPLMRVFTQGVSSGTIYLKNLTLTMGGRFQPPPAPAKYVYSADGPIEFFDTAAPTTGYWTRGSICKNLAPSAAGVVGWICVTAGTPGTWKSFGTIAS